MLVNADCFSPTVAAPMDEGERPCKRSTRTTVLSQKAAKQEDFEGGLYHKGSNQISPPVLSGAFAPGAGFDDFQHVPSLTIHRIEPTWGLRI